MRGLLLLLAIPVMVFAQTLNVVENEFVKIITGPEGFDHPRFSIETTGGDPSRGSDNNLPLIYGRPKPWTSYTSIAVGGTVYGFGTQTLKRAGKKARYGQVTSSSLMDDGMITTVEMGNVTGTQQLTLVRNPITNVKDAVLIEYQLRNNADVTQNIGLRMMFDTMLGSNDAAPFRIGDAAIESETVLKGDDIRDFWQSFDSLVSPNIIAQGMLRHAPAGLTPPDELILMNWGKLADQPYRVKATPGASFIRDGEDEPDTALALFYEKQPVGPGKSRTFRTMMGLGGITLAPGDLALGITAPASLAVTDPNTYALVAYISNTGGYTAASANATLTLPPGLELVGQPASTFLGDILSGGSRQLVYRVKVVPKHAKEGTQPLSLTVASDTLSDQTIQRNIEFLGAPKLKLFPINPAKIKRGLDQFVDVPVQVINPSPVPISNVQLGIHLDAPFELPSFESNNKTIPLIQANDSIQVLWKLKVNEWWQGRHQIPVGVESDFTTRVTKNAEVDIQLGAPKAQLYYSEKSRFINDYGYVWITLMDMPSFSGLDLTMTWDPELLKPIRVSPEPWLIESNKKIMDNFVITANRLSMNDLKADSPPWRMIIGKFHFKVLEEGMPLLKSSKGTKFWMI